MRFTFFLPHLDSQSRAKTADAHQRTCLTPPHTVDGRITVGYSEDEQPLSFQLEEKGQPSDYLFPAFLSPATHSILLLLALLPHWATSLVHSLSLSHKRHSHWHFSTLLGKILIYFSLSQIKHTKRQLPGGGDNVLPIIRPTLSWGSGC